MLHWYLLSVSLIFTGSVGFKDEDIHTVSDINTSRRTSAYQVPGTRTAFNKTAKPLRHQFLQRTFFLFFHPPADGEK